MIRGEIAPLVYRCFLGDASVSGEAGVASQFCNVARDGGGFENDFAGWSLEDGCFSSGRELGSLVGVEFGDVNVDGIVFCGDEDFEGAKISCRCVKFVGHIGVSCGCRFN